METQPRYKSILFWVGLISAVYEAVVASMITGGMTLPPVVGAIGVGLATVLVYCNGNNPCLKRY